MSRRSNVTVTHALSVSEVSERAWAGVAGCASFYGSRPWLLATSGLGGSESGCLLVRRNADGELLGALPTYLVHRQGGAYDPFSQFLPPELSRSLAPQQRSPVLLGGSCSGYSTDALLHAGLSAEERVSVQAELLAELVSRRDQAGAAAAAVMYITDEAIGAYEGAPAVDAVRLLGGAEAVLDVAWDSFAAYLRWLPPSRRSAVRREMRRLTDSGLTVDTARIGDVIEEITPLLASLQRRYGHGVSDAHVAALLRRQRRFLHDESVVFLARRGARLLGFSLFYQWRSCLWARAVGAPDPSPETRFVYFDVLFYTPIRHAIDCGLQRIHFGKGSLQGKVARGARLIPLWSLVWPASTVPLEVTAGLAARATDTPTRWRELCADAGAAGLTGGAGTAATAGHPRR